MGGKLTEIAIAEQEGLTNFKTVISSDHAYIHDGIAFTGIINTGSISAAYDIAFTTPSIADGKFLHWRPIGITTSADYVGFVLYEGDAFSAGTAVVPINRNRISSNVSKVTTLVKNATATPSGTVIDEGGVGTSGIATAKGGGGVSADEELVLIPATNYVLTLTPDAATVVTLKLFWYEEEEGLDDD